MVAEQILQRLEAEFDNPPEQIRAVVDLLDAGATPEFVALFRRDETGDPGEDRIVAIAERLRFLSELEARKVTLLQQAGERGHDVEELRKLLVDSVDQDLLDDVDHFLRPHEHKAEAQVASLGLGPLVDATHRHELGERTPQEAAAEYVRAEEMGVADADQVLAQVVLALAERYGEDPSLRARIRSELSRGILTASAATPAGAPAAPPPPQREQTPPPAAAQQVTTASEEPPAATPDEATASEGQPAATPDETTATEGQPAATPDEATATEGQPAATPDEASASDATETSDPAPAVEEAPATEPDPATESAPTAAAESTEVPSDPTTPAADTTAPAASESTPEAGGTSSDAPPATSASEAPAEPPSREAVEDLARTPRKGKRAKSPKPKGAGRYQQLLGLEEPVRRIPAGRMLALRRAEREGILQLKLVLKPGRELELFRERFSPDVDPTTPLGRFLDLVYGHAYDTYVHRPCEQTVRHHIKEKADRETVRTFARSLRAQLMSPVVEDGAVGALRVAGKSAWLAIIAPDGATKCRHTFPVPPDDAGRQELLKSLAEALANEAPIALAIPHGRREGPAKQLAREVLEALTSGGTPAPLVVSVDETAAVVWATSPQARRRHSQSDTGMRTTLSLARRLRDPLFELMRVEPRGLGLGQNLTEVHQGMLRRQLDATLMSCLARIGIDVNRADPALLARAPGISRDLAKAITQDRSANGPFKTLQDLKRVEAVDDATFVRISGFLRVHGGDDPLDATGVPPESRPLVERIAAREGVPPPELIGRELRGFRIEELVDDEFGFLRVRDTLDALRRGAHDVRGRVEPVRNEGVTSFDDLRVDQMLNGRVTNLAEFGAFVDLGVGQDGLVHVSQIPGSRLRDPARILRVGEVVRVYVVHVDPHSHKIGLSMMKPRHLAEGRPATLGERMGGGGGRRGRRGRREEPPVMNRAARAPEGRRGTMRRGPKPPRPKDTDRGAEGRGDDMRRGRPGRGPRSGPSGPPRVITVESDKVQETQRGHKGELRSLAGLKALLPKEPGEDKPKDEDAKSE